MHPRAKQGTPDRPASLKRNNPCWQGTVIETFLANCGVLKTFRASLPVTTVLSEWPQFRLDVAEASLERWTRVICGSYPFQQCRRSGISEMDTPYRGVLKINRHLITYGKKNWSLDRWLVRLPCNSSWCAGGNPVIRWQLTFYFHL